MTNGTIRAADAMARRHAFRVPGEEVLTLIDALEAATAATTFTVIAADIDRGAYDGRI